MWIDLHTRNGSASPLEEDCNGSVASPWIVAYSVSDPVPQGVRRWTASLHQLSLACIVALSKSGERDASIASLRIVAAVVLSDCCCHFRSSTVCSPTGMKVLRVHIAATFGAIVHFEAAYCCGASAFMSGIPRPSSAGGRVNSSRNSSGSRAVWPKRTGTKISLIASSASST